MYVFRSGPFVPKFAATKGSVIDLTSAAVADLSYVCVQPCYVSEVSLVITTAIVSTGPVVVKFYNRPTVGSAAGEVTIKAMSTGAADAAGVVRYALPTPQKFSVGQELAFEVTTAAAGGGAAGNAVAGFVAYESPEVAGNNSNMKAG